MLSQGLEGGLKARPEDSGSGCKEQVSRQSPHDATFGIMLSSGPSNSGLHNNLALYSRLLCSRKEEPGRVQKGDDGGLRPMQDWTKKFMECSASSCKESVPFGRT
jgi:hypothetical protein